MCSWLYCIMMCVKELAGWISTYLTCSSTTEFHCKDSRTSYSKDRGTSYSKDRGTRSTWYPSWWTTLSSSTTTTTWSCWCSVWSMYVLVVCMCCSIVSDILLFLVGEGSQFSQTLLPCSRLFSRGLFHKLAYSNFLRENFKNHQEQLVINAFSNIFNKHVKGNNVHEWQVIC